MRPLARSRNATIFDTTVADPGFPIGGRAPVRGCGPLMWVLFGENVCEKERIGSHRVWRAPGTPPPRSANAPAGQ